MISTLEKGVDHLILDDAVLQNFRASIRGSVITKDNSSYDQERSVYNGMIDRYPALIVKCRDVADVIQSIQFARTLELRVAIRSGGHNAGGLGVCDNGLVIDLSLMKGTRIDLENNTIRVESGCTLGDIDHATQTFGKAIPTGIFSTTGISGLTLGGGLGHLTRKHGLAIDNLIEADIALADGQVVTVSETKNKDLFWAIRGGGGNFGVITSFLFKMHDAGTVNGGPMLWHLEDGEKIMRLYRDYILTAPTDVYCYFAFLTVPPVPLFPAELHLKKMCGLVWCNTSTAEASTKAYDIFRQYKAPALDYTGPIPFDKLQSMFDALYPKGLQWYWKADFVKEISDESIKMNMKYAKKLPTPHSTMHLYPINGVAHKMKSTDTAFYYRDSNWAQVIVGVDPDPTNANKLAEWANDYWAAVHPFSAGGAYVNFMMEEGQDRVQASYQGNYSRLAEIKRKYDPTNFFRINQNIKPS